MIYYFWEMMRLVANSRHYLKTGEKNPASMASFGSVNIYCGEQTFNISDGNISSWLEFLHSKKVEDIYLEPSMTNGEYNFPILDFWNYQIVCWREQKAVLTLRNTCRICGHVVDHATRRYVECCCPSDFRPYIENPLPQLIEVINEIIIYEKGRGHEFAPEYDYEWVTFFDNCVKALRGENWDKVQWVKKNERRIPKSVPNNPLPSIYSQKANQLYILLHEYELFHGMGNWGDGARYDLVKKLADVLVKTCAFCINAGEYAAFLENYNFQKPNIILQAYDY